MEVILTQDVPNLGYTNDKVNVKPGYARNFLLPKSLAILATETNKKILAENLKQKAHKESKIRNESESMADKLKDITVKIGAKAAESGKIFGSVNAIQIAGALKDQFQLITTDVEKSFYTYIPGMPISLDTPTFRSTHLIYIDRALGVVPLMPKLERIVYPLNSYHYINIKEQIEKGLEYNLKIFNQLSVYNAITFYRPMYLYSTDKISWKKLQTTISSPTYNEFVNVDFHNNYDEFITGGNTYEEMITIPASKWTELIGDDLHASCWVLCNSYVPVIEVSHKTSEIDDTGEFLSIYDRIGRIVIQKCSI